MLQPWFDTSLTGLHKAPELFFGEQETSFSSTSLNMASIFRRPLSSMVCWLALDMVIRLSFSVQTWTHYPFLRRLPALLGESFGCDILHSGLALCEPVKLSTAGN